MRNTLRSLFMPLLGLLVILPAAKSQTVTGSITGTVVDQAGAVVTGASIELTNEVTKQVREFTTSDSGVLLYPNLVPASYQIAVKQAGFKKYSLPGITVGTLEKVH